MSEPGIRCSCGRRITAAEVIQHGFLLIQWQPIFVYLKYRCAECSQVGEELVAYDEWDSSVLLGDLETTEEAPTDRDTILFGQQLRSVSERDWELLRHTI